MVHEEAHLPIVADEVYEAAQARFENYSCGYSLNYGDTAGLEAHAGQKWISVREDWLERLVLRFFEQRILGPMRLDKLAKQLGELRGEKEGLGMPWPASAPASWRLKMRNSQRASPA